MKFIKTIIFASLLFILLLLFSYFQFSRPWDRALFIKPIYKLNTNKKVVALTFDDGPSPTRTPLLLDVLEKQDVKVTFFMLGNKIEQYPDISKSVVAKGHMVANHGYSHARLIFKSPWFIRDEVLKGQQALISIGSTNSDYFRPPYTSKLFALPLILRFQNMKLVTGTYGPPAQYQTPFNSNLVSQQVIDNAQPDSIIYLHDGRDDNPEEFADCVDIIITQLKEKDYTFATLE